MSEPNENRPSGPSRTDLDAARELLGRARRYLEQARKSPRELTEEEDPEELLGQLTEAMDTVESPDTSPPVAAEESEGAGRIRRIHRRRSA